MKQKKKQEERRKKKEGKLFLCSRDLRGEREDGEEGINGRHEDGGHGVNACDVRVGFYGS
mgnify:CR=1 FL=1